MFKLQPNPTFWATIEIPLPGDGGETAPLEIEFRHMTGAAWQARVVAWGNEGTQPIDALREVVVGWRGADIEFSDEALVQLNDNYAGAMVAIAHVYPGLLMGARRKNS